MPDEWWPKYKRDYFSVHTSEDAATAWLSTQSLAWCREQAAEQGDGEG